jgi:ATP-dependent helicase/nuclease subunit A
MMEREWTKQQRDAMEARGGTLLVSAAAGSGKTAVLVERLIGLITDEKHPCDADRLLVVTFTSAAASEMRERASKRLSDMIEQNPLDSNLQRQQMLLQNAHISTIHAFCLDLLREHFEKLDIPPDFRIADQNEIEIIRQDVLEDLLEEKYAFDMRGGKGDFLELSYILSSGRNDSLLVDTILRLYDFTRSLDDADSWLNKMLAMYDSGVPLKETTWGKVALEYAVQAAYSAIKSEHRALLKINENPQMQKAYAKAFESDIEGLKLLVQSADSGNWDDLAASVSNFSFERLGALRKFDDDVLKEEVKATRDNVKKMLLDLSKGVLCCTTSEFEEDINVMRPVVNCLAETVRELDRRFYKEKLSRGLLDFSDLEQLALKLLVKNDIDGVKFTQTAQEVSKRFDEVLVDEYQDTNPAQDMIFRAVSSGDKNLFMVGDVKQSIYRFRQAMPEIFIGRALHCAPYGKGIYPAKIILGRNFRSRAGVTSAINFIFDRLMSKELGGVDYGEEEKLIPGASYFERGGVDFALHIIGTSDDVADEDEADSKNVDIEVDGASETRRVDSTELEARHIASEIKSLVESGFTVQGENGARPVTYRDFCILLRSMSGRAEKYTRALEQAGIPVYADISSGYLGAYEVMVMLSLLRLLDNPLQDIPLSSVLLSPVFGFTPDDVSQIRIKSRKNSLYLAMLDLSKSGDSRFDEFIELLEKLRSLAAVLPADRLILRIYEETGFLNIFEAMPGGGLRRANLRLLLDYARSYESAGWRGLAGFIRFIDRVDRQHSDLAPASIISETADVVRVMSIHKSKGLEFPVCFLASCSKRFNNEDSTRPALFHPVGGFGSIIRERDLNCRFTTLPREAVKLETQKSMLSEEMRILYVAMTRAKEKLYAVMTIAKPESALKRVAGMSVGIGSGKILPYEAMSAQSPADWLLAAAIWHPSCGKLREIAGMQGIVASESEWEVALIKAGDIKAISPVIQEKKTTDEVCFDASAEIKKQIEKKLSYIYPFGKLSAIPSKVSVSELTHGSSQQNKKEQFNAEHVRPSFLEEERLTPAEIGTALHEFMQYADFKAIEGEDGIKAEVERLITSKFILPEQGKAVDVKRVVTFASSDIFVRLKMAKRMWREFRFNFEIPASELYDDIAGLDEKILMQGMADLVFEEDDGFVLLDYKTDRVTSAAELAEKYRAQLDCYARAVKEILQEDVKERFIYSFYLGKAIAV